MFTDLLNSSYFALFLIIVALGFMLGRIKSKDCHSTYPPLFSSPCYRAFRRPSSPRSWVTSDSYCSSSPSASGGTRLLRLLPEQRENSHHHHPAHYLLRRPLHGNGAEILDIDTPSVVGLIAGALTSTQGLAVAIDNTHSPLASIAYGMAYPFGVIGVILFVKLLPRIMHIDLEQEAHRLEKERRGQFKNCSPVSIVSPTP